MNPLIGIAVGVVPDIIKLIAGDKTGQLADQVGKAVADTVGTTNAGDAQTKLARIPLRKPHSARSWLNLPSKRQRLRTRKPASRDKTRSSTRRERGAGFRP
jgi:hypothetical protein